MIGRVQFTIAELISALRLQLHLEFQQHLVSTGEHPVEGLLFALEICILDLKLDDLMVSRNNFFTSDHLLANTRQKA